MWRAVAGAVLWSVANLGANADAQGTIVSSADVAKLMAEHRYAEAETVAKTYLEQHQKEAQAYFLLGKVLFHEQKASESLAEFSTGSAYHQPGPDEQKVIAFDYVLLKNLGQADGTLSRVVAEQPSDADAWYLLGRIKFNENDFEQARAHLERSLALRPKHVEAENNIGLCWKELGEKEKARTAFARAIEWQGEHANDAQPFLNLGELMAEQGDSEQASQLLEQAVALAPTNPKVHEALADSFIQRQDLERAKSELLRSVELAPEVSALHYKLGHIYRRTGQIEQARREFAICAQLNSTHSSAKTPNPYTPVP